ncbi:MAG: hypothetical protein DMF56_21090 [Acidobacteria bacterium]|nr:MAG: hypothetical protein DMF56_21090 [Acidobacteriota bacterium]
MPLRLKSVSHRLFSGLTLRCQFQDSTVTLTVSIEFLFSNHGELLGGDSRIAFGLMSRGNR